MDPIICPNCSELNKPDLEACWKCHYSFLTGRKLFFLWVRTRLVQIAAWVWRFFGWLLIPSLVALVLFSWGLVSRVVMGNMTTGEYIREIGLNVQAGGEKVMSLWSGPVLGTFERLTNVESLRNGPSRKYFKNGRLQSEMNYKNGKLEGPAKMYYESGKLKAEGLFKNGQLDGVAKEYDENGNPK